MINTLVIKRFYARDVNVGEMMMVCLNLCMHNHFGIEIIFPNRDVV